ncbi:DNA translocase FtsK [Candidatus Dojkabacteria bacterium]|uniref:DNA translocase FtsK n=1 Tax=Candidatus Dojkabacteria bacterium TaxID=2099670 RepID=A0A3M0Z438_9BACT|nr:MAG: DNA translocase FtsK [Candidatus Dojkabacteria bacterium]
MPRRKHITYDSQETKIFFSVVCLSLSVFFFLSFTTPLNENNFLGQGRNLFGDSSIVVSIFFLVIGLRLLKIKTPFSKTSNIFALFVLCLLVPAFLTSISIGNSQISRICDTNSININKCQLNCDNRYSENFSGGLIGCFILERVFKENVPVGTASRLLLFVLIIGTLPTLFSVPYSVIYERLALFFRYLKGTVFKSKNNSFGKIDYNTPNEVEVTQRFDDFNKEIKKTRIEENTKVKTRSNKEVLDYIPQSSNTQVNGSTDKGLEETTLRYPNWKLPPISLLIPYQRTNQKENSILENTKIIEKTLLSFGIDAKVVKSFVGPSVVVYALSIPLGIAVQKITALSASLALALKVDSDAIRIESLPDTPYLGIEVPRSNREIVRFKELMEFQKNSNIKYHLPIPIGKNVDGSYIVYDLQKLPHLLIAGATGSGKSVLTNSFISSLLMNKTPDELRLILVDPKQVELIDYNGIPHLLTSVVTEMNKVVNVLKWLVYEMERRYTVLASERVRNIQSYNEKKGFSAMPFIVVVIDEMADMMMTSNKVEAETAIVRIAQKARAVGIHLILATQRPSVNVITGIIKANIPGRIGMSVTSSVDSRVILDRVGAESLLGKGDLLFKAPDRVKPDRLQAPNIEQEEISRIVDFIKSQSPEVEYLDEILEKSFLGNEPNMSNDLISSVDAKGSLLEQAIRIAVQYNKGSSSFIQRKLSIGFNKAAELVERMEELGVVGPQVGQKPREVLISDAEEFIKKLKSGEI